MIAQVVQARRRQGRGLDRLQLQVDTRDLVIGPAERAQEKVVLGLREDNPFAAPGPDQSADGEAHEWTSSGAHSCLEWLRMAFGDALRVLNAMKSEGVIDEYAIAGAMALVFWTQPVSTYDLDVLVFLPSSAGPLVSLDGLYRWAAARGYKTHKEHIIIEGVPTQFLPSPGDLGDAAIETAETLEYDGVPARVALPEYLVALYVQPEARTLKRRERAARLVEWPGLNRGRLDAILKRHGLSL